MRAVGNTETEVIANERASRRHRSKQERRQIAEESLQSGTSVAVVARGHGVNANQIFHWRKLLRDGRLDAHPALAHLMPVHIAELAENLPTPARPQNGVIHLELGRARVRVEGSVDPEALRLILEQLSR